MSTAYNTLRETIGGQVLVPAAAVIPAPIVHIKVAAIKKHVAGFWGACIDPTQ
jgi:hypothetical protein